MFRSGIPFDSTLFTASECDEGNSEECDSNKCNLSALFYKIHAANVDSKDIKVCFGDEKSKSSNITVQSLRGVFSKSSWLTCDSFR